MRSLFKVLGALLVINVAPFAQAETLSEAMQACTRVENSLKRLVCFDRLAQRANGMQDVELPDFVSRQPMSSSNTERPAYTARPQNDAQSDFGFENQRAREEKSEESEMTAVVAKLDKYGRGRLQITLDNGQVWQQSTGDTLQNLRVGEVVVISRGVLGAFYLREHDGKKRILVKRSS